MLDVSTLVQLNRQIPRYTSYPTAPQFSTISEDVYRKKLFALRDKNAPISLYIHIPFCRSMCLFCACSVTLNRKPERQTKYLQALHKEMELLHLAVGKKLRVEQLHFGGGTPTSLSEEELTDTMRVINDHFDIDYSKEISMEIDPRTVFHDQGKKLKHLKTLGFNRVSFGVQDVNSQVQEAVKRRQSAEMTLRTFEMAKSLNFNGINVDLIYGLPKQTVETFYQTANFIAEMRPDRIAFFSYAKVPWLKPHQKAISDEDLPSTEEKFQIYLDARNKFIDSGYTAIGMDHFSLPEDPLTKALHEKKLYRNFQGYSVCFAKDMVGLGNTAIGYVSNMYVQNIKKVEDYEEAVFQGRLPVALGKELSCDDLMRKWVIMKIMCDFGCDKKEFEERYGSSFDEVFFEQKSLLDELIEQGLIEDKPHYIQATELGKLFIRNVACVFDRYLQNQQSSSLFSRSV